MPQTGSDNTPDERFISPAQREVSAFTSRRPESLDAFVGQAQVKANIRVMMEAAQKRGAALEHILFAGPPGLGKTTLANIIAHEMGVTLTSSTGPLLERAGDLLAILTGLQERQVLFIDEIHRLNRAVEETLYSAMEQFKVDVIIGKGPGAKTIPLNLSPFTLIGATTRSGLLTAPLRDQFGALFHLGFYAPEDLAEIIRRKAREHGITIGDECLLAIAARSRGTPRVALRLFKRVWDFAVVAGSNEISRDLAEESLKRLGITDEGLDEMDRRILTLIIRNFSGGPVGIATLSAVLNEERDTLEDVYEPYLMKAGFLEKTPRGRCATQKAYEYFRVPFTPARMQPGAVEPLFGNEESCEETEG